LTLEGCPINTPFKCPDGTCKTTARGTDKEEGC
jgi:hypothetical protein